MPRSPVTSIAHARARKPNGSEPVDRVERHILPFIQESTLWPVLLVVIGHAGVVIALAILMAVLDRNPIAWLALAALAVLSLRVPAYEVNRWRRPGALSAIALSVWLLAAGLAAVAHHYGAW